MLTKDELERYAEVVHNRYLEICDRLGWSVRPENRVSYSELSEEAKELDRATVLVVLEKYRDEGNC